MKEVYNKIWKLAQLFYLNGRPMDMAHITWMMNDAFFVCETENLDDSLLLPLVILHDVGYADLPSKHPFSVSSKKEHMKQGAKIASEILAKVHYPKDKIQQITHYISVHDNWLLGDDTIFKKDLLLAVFNDLDYMWMATSQGFSLLAKHLGKTPQEMLHFLDTNEKLTRRPFATKTTKKLYERYMSERKTDLLS